MKKLIINKDEIAGYLEFLTEEEVQELIEEFDSFWLWNNGEVSGIHDHRVHTIYHVGEYNTTGIDFSRCEDER